MRERVIPNEMLINQDRGSSPFCDPLNLDNALAWCHLIFMNGVRKKPFPLEVFTTLLYKYLNSTQLYITGRIIIKTTAIHVRALGRTGDKGARSSPQILQLK